MTKKTYLPTDNLTLAKRNAREKLSQTFAEKGIKTEFDRRRIMLDSIGHKTTISKSSLEERNQILEYLESKSPEELKSPYIAWLNITEQGIGFTKNDLRDLMSKMPPETQLIMVPVHIDEEGFEPLSVLSYVDLAFYQKQPLTVMENLQSIHQKLPIENTVGTYLLDRQYNLTSYTEFLPSAEQTKQLLEEKKQKTQERRAYMKQKRAEINNS